MSRRTDKKNMKIEDLKLCQAITTDEVEALAAKIHVGDPIRWRVWDSDSSSQKSVPKKRETLTVIRKSRHLLEAEDGRGRVYSNRYVELAEEKRRKGQRKKMAGEKGKVTA